MNTFKGLQAIVAALTLLNATNVPANTSNITSASSSSVSINSTNPVKKLYELHLSKGRELSEKARYGKGISINERIQSVGKSLQEFDNALNINATIDAMIEKSDLLISFGDLKNADNLLDKVIQKNPENSQAYRLKGRILRQTGNIKGGEELQRKALMLDDKFPLNYTSLAFTLYAQNKIEESETLYLQALALTKDSKDKKHIEARYDALLTIGEICIRRKELGKARQYFEEAKSVDDRQPNAYVALGKLKMRENDPSAITEFERAIERYPGETNYQQLLNKARQAFQK